MDIISNFRKRKKYIYNNYKNHKDPIINESLCRILDITLIFHILILNVMYISAIVTVNRGTLYFIIFGIVTFLIVSIYSNGCWVTIPERMIRDKYNCDNRPLTKFLINVLDSNTIVPELYVSMIIAFIVVLLILFKLKIIFKKTNIKFIQKVK